MLCNNVEWGAGVEGGNTNPKEGRLETKTMYDICVYSKQNQEILMPIEIS